MLVRYDVVPPGYLAGSQVRELDREHRKWCAVLSIVHV